MTDYHWRAIAVGNRSFNHNCRGVQLKYVAERQTDNTSLNLRPIRMREPKQNSMEFI
jgi:hypothetical protein